MFRVDCYDDGFYPCHYYLIIININNLLIYINTSFVYVHTLIIINNLFEDILLCYVNYFSLFY